MRVIIVIILALLVVSGLLAAKLPHIAKSLPVVGAIGTWMQDIGLIAVLGKVLQAIRDISDITRTRELGIWHVAVLVLAVLLVRRMIVWLVH